MSDKKNILYVQTSDMPERQYSPLVLAQTAKAMDIDAKVYYLGLGLKILLPGEAEKIQYVPGEEGIKACNELGKKIAKELPQ